MRNLIRVAATAGLGIAAFAPGALAQDMTTYNFGGTTLWIGGGFQYLTLPDIKFTGKDNAAGTNFRHQTNSDFSEYGGGGGGGIETALGYWNGMRVTGGVKGFWTTLDNSENSHCRTGICVVFDPTGAAPLAGPPTLTTKTNRDVDYWGRALLALLGAAGLARRR